MSSWRLPTTKYSGYVGETERTVASRLSEHFSTARISGTSTLKSAVMAHAREENHHFRRSDFSVLSSGDQNWHNRGVKEAIFIRALQPTINRDQGRHLLPPNFDALLQQHVKRPNPARVHVAAEEPLLSTAPRRQGRPPRQSQAPLLPPPPPPPPPALTPLPPPSVPIPPMQVFPSTQSPSTSLLSSQTILKAAYPSSQTSVKAAVPSSQTRVKDSS